MTANTDFIQLDNESRDAIVAFLSQAPEANVVPLYNINRFGMDTGDAPLNGYYFCKRKGSGLAAVGVVYNVGSLFFHAFSEAAVSGMAEHIISAGKSPFFTEGPRAQIQLLLSELKGIYDAVPRPMSSERLVLEGDVKPGIDTSRTRRSRLEDMDELVSMGRAMHREMFGIEGMDEQSFREIFNLQITDGGAVVREVDGRVVSKAEATMFRPLAGLIGGVYTLPEFRGRGHSTACVAALSKHLLKEVETATLTAEPDNHAACRMYRRIGFKKREDWITVSFDKN